MQKETNLRKVNYINLSKKNVIKKNYGDHISFTLDDITTADLEKCLIKRTGPNDEQPYRMVTWYSLAPDFTCVTIYEDEGGSVQLLQILDSERLNLVEIKDQLNAQDDMIAEFLEEWSYMDSDERKEFDSKQDFIDKQCELNELIQLVKQSDPSTL